MIIKSEECARRKANLAGGNGLLDCKILATPDQMYNHVRVFNHVTIAPGHSIGDHPHTGETEFYYVLKGNPTFNDNGEEVVLNPGDFTSTANGEIHGVVNNTDEMVEIIALIPQDN